eukprot:364443-Chlamydomonas_euryale.AAC.36
MREAEMAEVALDRAGAEVGVIDAERVLRREGRGTEGIVEKRRLRWVSCMPCLATTCLPDQAAKAPSVAPHSSWIYSTVNPHGTSHFHHHHHHHHHHYHHHHCRHKSHCQHTHHHHSWGPEPDAGGWAPDARLVLGAAELPGEPEQQRPQIA